MYLEYNVQDYKKTKWGEDRAFNFWWCKRISEIEWSDKIKRTKLPVISGKKIFGAISKEGNNIRQSAVMPYEENTHTFVEKQRFQNVEEVLFKMYLPNFSWFSLLQ